MPKDNNQVELERQQNEMLGKGATHNEIHNPNTRSNFNNTGYLPNQGSKNQSTAQTQRKFFGNSKHSQTKGSQSPKPQQKKDTKGSSTALVIIAAIGVYFLSVTYITENLIVAGVIAAISAWVFYKYGKKLLIAGIVIAAIYFFFLKD